MGTKETEGRTRRGVTINLRADAKHHRVSEPRPYASV